MVRNSNIGCNSVGFLEQIKEENMEDVPPVIANSFLNRIEILSEKSLLKTHHLLYSMLI